MRCVMDVCPFRLVVERIVAWVHGVSWDGAAGTDRSNAGYSRIPPWHPHPPCHDSVSSSCVAYEKLGCSEVQVKLLTRPPLQNCRCHRSGVGRSCPQWAQNQPVVAQMELGRKPMRLWVRLPTWMLQLRRRCWRPSPMAKDMRNGFSKVMTLPQ